jgi:phosphoribosylformimino-5-aminoimidazole carboxamide ribotide isomerase
MIIYPAIDIKNGKCVRLAQGQAKTETIYNENPLETAKKWESAGAAYLHVVDLDGAFNGDSSNLSIIEAIAKHISIPMQLGGGIRSMAKIEKLLEEVGVSRVILGTSAIENPDLLFNAVKKYGKRIAVGIDAKNGKVAVRGWVELKELSAIEFGKRIVEQGVDTIIYTDISRDGMLAGPNIQAIYQMVKQTKLNVIASGGVSKLEDLEHIRQTGAAGVIIGKALYAKNIDLCDALSYQEG